MRDRAFVRFYGLLVCISGCLAAAHGQDQMPAITDQSKLNPALQVTQASLEREWQAGFKDAEKRRNYPLMNSLQREIGKVHTSLFREEAISFITMMGPEQSEYLAGYAARKEYWSDDQVRTTKGKIAFLATGGRRHLYFSGFLRIVPSFNANGFVRKGATPDELKDVHVVLKVGDRIIQPELQPGDLAYQEQDTSRAIDQVATTQSQTSGNATVTNNSGQTLGTVSGTATTTNYYTVQTIQNFPTYLGRFVVSFDLFDHDGQPRISPETHEIEVIVVYGNNERHAKYDMEELNRLLHG